MNRIILIGNGFDLAHKMKTSYHHFITDYWEYTIEEIKQSRRGRLYENSEFSIEISPSGFVVGKSYNDLKQAVSSFKTTMKFKNKFLQIITEKAYIDNWVDVENEYYSLLKKSYNTTNKKIYKIKELNFDFENVKNLLRDYLIRVEQNFEENLDLDVLRTKSTIGHKIYHPFNFDDFSEKSLNQRVEQEYDFIKSDIKALKNGTSLDDLTTDSNRKLIEEIGLKEPKKGIKRLLRSSIATNYFDLIPDNTLFLNFNYTSTDKLYNVPRDFNQFDENKFNEFIYIHGTTDIRDKNPIIFGFGDELDEDYKGIEKLNDNRYLENIKSINYLETDNYKKLLEFTNTGNFQVFIFGHSCGISDRTLLNTIFEHENCASIKPFYHKQNENEDNYSDIVRNISRNFNDKAMMRDRVVNKTFCKPLC